MLVVAHCLAAIRNASWSYPPEVQRHLPLLHAQDLDAPRHIWLRSGLHDVLVEELAWIDEAMRTAAQPDEQPMQDELRFYLIEGTRDSSVRP